MPQAENRPYSRVELTSVGQHIQIKACPGKAQLCRAKCKRHRSQRPGFKRGQQATCISEITLLAGQRRYSRNTAAAMTVASSSSLPSYRWKSTNGSCKVVLCAAWTPLVVHCCFRTFARCTWNLRGQRLSLASFTHCMLHNCLWLPSCTQPITGVGIM